MVPPGSLFMGHPGKFGARLRRGPRRASRYAARYVEYSETYRSEAVPGAGGCGAACEIVTSPDVKKFQAIKGVRDILPPDSALWNRVEPTAREVFGTYGYGEIRLPIFEPTELFARSIGAETDIVSKEMYTFRIATRSSGDSLRPEATASVVRAYIEQACTRGPETSSFTTWGRCFGASGRRRDVTGSSIRLARNCLGLRPCGAGCRSDRDAAWRFSSALAEGAVLYINSIGDKNCRPLYVERAARGAGKSAREAWS